MLESPKTRNPDLTRQRILLAATELFSLKGFNGSSVNEIVQACQVNKRMVYHYFGDKHGLYRQVFIQQWQNLGVFLWKSLQQQSTLGPSKNASKGHQLFELDQILAALFNYMAQHPEFVRLLTWEGLEGGEISRSIWQEVRGPLFDQVMAWVHKAQAEGVISKDLDGGHLITIFLGSVVFYFGQAGSLGDLIGGDPLKEEHRRRYQKHLITLLRCLIQSPAPPPL